MTYISYMYMHLEQNILYVEYIYYIFIVCFSVILLVSFCGRHA